MAGVSPASVTFGAPSIASTGATAAAVELDIGNLFSLITTNRAGLVLILHTRSALNMLKLRTTNGNPVFPGLTLTGGFVMGVPTIVSANAPMEDSSPEQRFIIALDAAEVLFGDNGIELDASANAIVQMDSSPTHPVAAATVMQSLWQMNLAGIKVTRLLNWARRRSGAAAYISGVIY